MTFQDPNSYVGHATPVDGSELARLYWTTTTSLDDLHPRFGEGTGKSHLYRRAGEAKMDVPCADCGTAPLVKSRAGAVAVLYPYRGTYRCEPCSQARRKIEDEERYGKWRQKAEEGRQKAAREEALRWMPYPEFLGSEEWAVRRRGALTRAEFRCQVCAAEGKLHVHHRTYARRGAERPADLTVLCAECHEIFHLHGKLAEKGRAA